MSASKNARSCGSWSTISGGMSRIINSVRCDSTSMPRTSGRTMATNTVHVARIWKTSTRAGTRAERTESTTASTALAESASPSPTSFGPSSQIVTNAEPSPIPTCTTPGPRSASVNADET
eukprot:Amastigsp_a512755_8.p3 type:complete len:120 gc:universal Amastigsp_a512755_8:609-250(-)